MPKIVRFDEKLLHCIQNGRNSEVRFFLWILQEAHKQIDHTRATLLHYAAEYGNGGIARYLIELGSDVDAQNVRGQTPLMLAIHEERVTTIRVLLEFEANIHITDNDGNSALKMVVESSLISESTIQTFLYRLKEESLFQKYLLAQKLSEIHCPLRIALFLDDAEITRLMLEKGNYDVNDPDPEMGDTALHIAVRRSSLEHVELLLEYGANVNAHTLSGCTPLSNLELKSKVASLKILKLLLDRGAMVFTENEGVKRWQISYLLDCGCRKAIHLLMQYNVDLCAVDSQGSTVLHYLARNTNLGVFNELKGRQFDVNARNDALYTPLHLVLNNYSSLKFLMKHGADVNANRDGITPFTQIFRVAWLCDGKREDTYERVKLFLKYGADPQFISSDGVTIFDHILDNNSFYVLTPVLAHLALLEHTGTPINDYIRSKIVLNPVVEEYFDMCKRELDHLKTKVLWESITVYKLLAVSERQLTLYMRQQQLIDKFYHDLPPAPVYKELINERVKKAIAIARLREHATISFCNSLKLPYEMYYLIIENMVINYLSLNDMRKLSMLSV